MRFSVLVVVVVAAVVLVDFLRDGGALGLDLAERLALR